MGTFRVSIYIRDIRLHNTDDRLALESARLYEKVRRGDNVAPKEAAACLPDRAFAGQVYRYIRDHIFYEDDIDLMCYRLGGDGSEVCRALMTIDVLKELGVLRAEESGRLVTDDSQKAPLEQSALLRQVLRLTQ
jgi:hypothetical protein